MQELDLSKNTLTTLENLTFTPLQTLVDLRLSHNKINAIEASAFEGLSRLRVLYLGTNHILNRAKVCPFFAPLIQCIYL